MQGVAEEARLDGADGDIHRDVQVLVLAELRDVGLETEAALGGERFPGLAQAAEARQRVLEVGVQAQVAAGDAEQQCACAGLAGRDRPPLDEDLGAVVRAVEILELVVARVDEQVAGDLLQRVAEIVPAHGAVHELHVVGALVILVARHPADAAAEVAAPLGVERFGLLLDSRRLVQGVEQFLVQRDVVAGDVDHRVGLVGASLPVTAHRDRSRAGEAHHLELGRRGDEIVVDGSRHALHRVPEAVEADADLVGVQHAVVADPFALPLFDHHLHLGGAGGAKERVQQLDTWGQLVGQRFLQR